MTDGCLILCFSRWLGVCRDFNVAIRTLRLPTLLHDDGTSPRSFAENGNLQAVIVAGSATGLSTTMLTRLRPARLAL